MEEEIRKGFLEALSQASDKELSEGLATLTDYDIDDMAFLGWFVDVESPSTKAMFNECILLLTEQVSAELNRRIFQIQ